MSEFAEFSSACDSFGQSSSSTCLSAPAAPTTVGTLIETSRSPYAPVCTVETGRISRVSSRIALTTAAIDAPTAYPAPPLRLITSAPLWRVRSKILFWKLRSKPSKPRD